MTLPPGSDLLLVRDRAEILDEILSARTGFVPDWLPSQRGAGRGLAEITAGQLELQERLRQVPAHRLAVLLDMLGASQLPAQGARTHVLLTAPPGTRGSRVPRGTRIGATVPGREAPVVFETQQDVAISSAVLAEVHSVLPAADAEQDHSADVLGQRPFMIFGDLAPVDRELFIGHDELLAFDGRAVVEVELGVSVPPPRPWRLEWTWWDGRLWRPFAALKHSPLGVGDDDSIDGTLGLTRSGTVRLVAPVATAVPLELDGQESHWIRARLATPLDLPEGALLPTIWRLRLSVVNEHRRLRVYREPVRGSAAHVKIAWPDAPLDEKVVVVIHDASDGSDNVTYQAGNPKRSDPVMGSIGPAGKVSEPVPMAAHLGHDVRLGVSLAAARRADVAELTRSTPRRVVLDLDGDLTPPQRIESGERLNLVVARGLALDKGIADRRAVDLSKTFAPLGPSPERGTAFVFACATATARPGSRVTLLIERPETAAEHSDRNADLQRDAAATTILERDAIVQLLEKDATAELTAARTKLDAVVALLPDLLGPELVDANGDPVSASDWFNTHRDSIRGKLMGALGTLAYLKTYDPLGPLGNRPAEVWGFITGANLGGPIGVAAMLGDIAGKVGAVIEALGKVRDEDLPHLFSSKILGRDPRLFVQDLAFRLGVVRQHIENALAKITEAAARLDKLSPTTLAVQLAQPETTKLTLPRVEWEYHDGSRWRALGVEGDERVVSLVDSGALHFTVPDDISDVDVDGDVRRWLRARLAEGTFARMTLVSWVDPHGTANFLPVVEPRPPLVDRIELFYSHRSDAVDASSVKVHDVHRWNDLTAAVTWPSSGASPFVPMEERAPTLYFGFDAELPADTVGLWMHPADPSPWAAPHRPVWEGWDGQEWTRLAVQDGTDGLRREGVVRLVWPGTDAAPGVTVVGALGTAISLAGRGAGLRFVPGDRLMLSDAQGQVPVLVAQASGETIVARAPLPRAFAGARLVAAPPPRFGSPRTWIRAEFDPVRPPPALTLRLAAHAVEVEQSETIRDEVLGSGDGSAGQVLIAQRFPVAADAELEVRELDGDRADLDRDVLERTLEAEGIDPASVRVARDQRTGRVTEVWVRWIPVPSLGGAQPGHRMYVIDSAQGRFAFGDGLHGKPLPAGRDNVRLREYRTTAGPIGNVEAGGVAKLLSAVAVSEVVNPVRASGGAAVESLDRALERASGLLRHRRLALTEADAEAIAVEASPAVVRARAIGARDQWGRPLPGAVRVVIVPRDGSDRPAPSAALLARVRDALVAASPSAAVPRVKVEPPAYLAVGVTVTVIPLASASAGEVRERVVTRLVQFLHPLHGGPEGEGWDFGAGAHISDVARALEELTGVDSVTGLTLTVDGVPSGDTAGVRPDQIICAGPLIVRLSGGA